MNAFLSIIISGATALWMAPAELLSQIQAVQLEREAAASRPDPIIPTSTSSEASSRTIPGRERTTREAAPADGEAGGVTDDEVSSEDDGIMDENEVTEDPNGELSDEEGLADSEVEMRSTARPERPAAPSAADRAEQRAAARERQQLSSRPARNPTPETEEETGQGSAVQPGPPQSTVPRQQSSVPRGGGRGVLP